MGDPTVPEHVLEAAEWWSENNARFWRSRRALLDWVGSHGPIRIADGRLVGYVPDGHSWDADGVAAVMPTLITNVQLRFDGPTEDMERLLSMALEEMPGVSYEVERTMDATAANAVIRAGGEAAEKLQPLRTNKSKLGVR